MNLSTNQKIGLGVLAGIALVLVYNKMSPQKLKLKTSGVDGDFGESFAEGDNYDFDADYDLAEGEDISSLDGDDSSNASGEKGKKRKLKHWQRRVKILTKKINLATKGLIKAQGRVDKWKAKLTEAQNKVAEFSK